MICPHHLLHVTYAPGNPGKASTRHARRGDATESFWLALLTGFAVQGFKGFAAYFATRRWDLQRFVATGGMPSAHAASVAALSTSVGLAEGFRSTLFGAALFFSLIVMYDAAGLRRAAGRQAVILNRLIEEHFRHPEEKAQKLFELLGHTPFEVLVGAVIGIGVALFYHMVL